MSARKASKPTAKTAKAAAKKPARKAARASKPHKPAKKRAGKVEQVTIAGQALGTYPREKIIVLLRSSSGNGRYGEQSFSSMSPGVIGERLGVRSPGACGLPRLFLIRYD